MAIFHMQIKAVGRTQGRNAPASAAYRAGELIRNERTGAVYDHRKRQDVLYKEILLPSALERDGTAPEWLRDRSSLWNAAERAEHQRNSRVAREYMVALPAELPAEQRLILARAFSREIAERFNVVVDLAVHAPRPHGDPRNFHAHLLTTTREVTSEGLGAKTGLDMQGTVRAELGAPPARQQFKALRERWAVLANEALQNAQVAARVDHRSLAEQGVDREPRPNLPIAAVAALRRGERSVVAERINQRYRERVASRKEAALKGKTSPAFHAEVADTTRPVSPMAGADASSLTVGQERAPTSPAPRDSAQRRRQAVKDWLAYRAAQGRPIGSDSDRSPQRRQSEDLRRKALEAWRGQRAKEGERRDSQIAADRSRTVAPDSVLEQRSRDPDFSL